MSSEFPRDPQPVVAKDTIVFSVHVPGFWGYPETCMNLNWGRNSESWKSGFRVSDFPTSDLPHTRARARKRARATPQLKGWSPSF